MWPFPAEDQDPWYNVFLSMVQAMDASGYAAREDRQLLLGGGGNVEFTASSGLITWNNDFLIFSTISGFLFTIPVGSVTLADGQIAYTIVNRSPTGNATLAFTVADNAPNTDGALIFAIRNGSSVYWRNGSKSDDGVPGNIFAGGGGGGGGGNTLNGAYDQGGAGAGRTITADADAVVINGASDANAVLEIGKPGGTGDGIVVTQSGSGRAINVASGDVVVGTLSGMSFPGQISVGTATNAGVTVRDTALGVETEIFSGNASGTSAGQVGTNTNHPLEFYTNALVKWNIQTNGDLDAELNGQVVRAGVVDISHEPGADDNLNHIVGGNGSLAPVSPSNKGHIRYNESTNKWQYSENTASYVDFDSGGGGGLPATIGVQFAALIEDPANTPKFAVLTQDMIQPAFVVTLNLFGTNIFEVGDDIVNPSFTVSYANGTPASATIDDGAGPSPGVPLTGGFTGGTIPETYSSSAGSDANGEQQVFDVVATSTLGITKGDTDTATWLPRVFWDDIPDAAYTEAFIEAMAGNELRSSRNKTISYNTGASEYMFYAFPTDYGGGTPSFIDQATGFAAGFTKVAPSVSVTNSFGNIQTYEIWRSNNPNLGARTIDVS